MLYIDRSPTMCDLINSIKAHRFFLRLGDVSQHGTLGKFFPEYIWRTFSYTRLEHSLGVAALSRRFGDRLQKLTSHLHCADPRRVSFYHTFILELACLLHDVGHGPLSHQFDRFLETLRQEGQNFPDHEERSVRIINYILDECWDVRSSEKEFPGGLRR